MRVVMQSMPTMNLPVNAKCVVTTCESYINRNTSKGVQIMIIFSSSTIVSFFG